jgi:hypothetical protein
MYKGCTWIQLGNVNNQTKVVTMIFWVLYFISHLWWALEQNFQINLHLILINNIQMPTCGTMVWGVLIIQTPQDIVVIPHPQPPMHGISIASPPPIHAVFNFTWTPHASSFFYISVLWHRQIISWKNPKVFAEHLDVRNI